jgi:hypothetical protein
VTDRHPESGGRSGHRPPGSARQRREDERRDRDLAPRDRGPVRAFLRDEVDARRRLVGAFLPVLGIAVISALSPASDAFPDEQVPGLATGWYAFLRAHRSRSVRQPPPRVAPRGRAPSPGR